MRYHYDQAARQPRNLFLPGGSQGESDSLSDSHSPVGATQFENGNIRALLPSLGVAGLVFVVCWPAAKRIAFSADDLGFYLYSSLALTLPHQMVEAWNSGLFRPWTC